MKKKLCLITALLLAFSCIGCGNSDSADATTDNQQTASASTEETDVFPFTMNDFVSTVDDFLGHSEKKLLSTYEFNQDGNKVTYTLADGVYLYAEISESSSKVEGIILYETLEILNDVDVGNYTALLIDSIASVDPQNLEQIVSDLNLTETDEGIFFAEGLNGKYIYQVEDGIAKVSILPL